MTKIEQEAMRNRVVELAEQVRQLRNEQWTLCHEPTRWERVPTEDRARVKKEIEEAFSSLSDDHPVWVALNKLLAIQLHV